MELRIVGLQKAYGETPVLKDINLDSRDGEFIVLVGPSGCGKTTLLRTIAGLERATAGDVFIGGNRVNELSPAQRNVAMVFQDYALYPHMTVRENLAFGLESRGVPRREIDEQIRRAAEMLQIQGYLDRKPAQLSGGQRQRVAIGRALVRKPSLFLFDEPLSNLDAKLRAQTRIEIGEFQKELGVTSVYVTHDQAEAMTLADRIVLMHKGRVQQAGSPLDLYDRPANRFVATFIGSPSMNLVPAVLDRHPAPVVTMGETSVEIDGKPAPERGGKYVVGFRPEALSVRLEETRGGIPASFVLVEFHGHELHVVTRALGQQIIVRSTDSSIWPQLKALKPKARLWLVADFARAHWFSDTEVGDRVPTVR